MRLVPLVYLDVSLGIHWCQHLHRRSPDDGVRNQSLPARCRRHPGVAVEVDVEGFSLDAVGVILMIVGGIGLIGSIIFWNTWGGFGRRRRVIEEDV